MQKLNMKMRMTKFMRLSSQLRQQKMYRQKLKKLLKSQMMLLMTGKTQILMKLQTK